MARIAVQASTIKNKFKELGPYEALKKMAEVGYHCIELSQVDMSPESIKEIKRAMADFDIEVCAITGGPTSRMKEPNLVNDFDTFVWQCKELNCKYIRIGAMPMPEMETVEKLAKYCALCEETCAKLEKEGIKLYYHNHNTEYQKKNGKTVFEIIKDSAPSLGCELDVHWAQRGGMNPVKAIKMCDGILDLLHLKDYRIKEVTPAMFEGKDMTDPATVMAVNREYGANRIEFAEIGQGNLDWPEIIEAGLAAGAKYLIVEQDSTYGRDEYESLAISAEYLKSIGYADCF
ncbi:MAG: sugar phosphate isomerase/epimerase [Clostridia bacterium]|nr:sugar phosphate isomerase/epimerase [Clostridia bacterium]